MSIRTTQILGAVALVLVLAAAYVAIFGLYPRYFDIEWDEEVQLHDGRVAIVHVKNTYERRGMRLSRFEDTTFRRNELTFDAGGGLGRVTLGSRLGVSHLDQIDGIWYAVLFGQGPYGNHPDERPYHWGSDFTMQEERLARLDKERFVPIAWELAPPGAILFNNRVVGSMPLEVLAGFNHKQLTLDDKKRLRASYPPGPGGGQISRPLRMKQTQGRLGSDSNYR